MALLAAVSGCAGLQLREREIRFEDPVERLAVQEVQPNETEKAGVVLRFNPPPEGLRRAREETVVYARVKGNRGLEVRTVEDQTEKFRPGSRQDSYFDLKISTFEGESGELTDEAEITTRGEIVKFIKGVHESKLGSLRIVGWTRTAALPEGPVKIGDRWGYDEAMDVRIKSWVAKEEDPQPYKIKAQCTLTGFALVRGKRTAIVKVHAVENRTERLKILFKRITMDASTDVEEVDYIDYAAGVVMAKVTRSRGVNVAPDYGYRDEERSQSVFTVL